MMRELFNSAAKYAQTVTVRSAGGEKTAKAFIQPESTVSPEYEAKPTPLGLADDRRYIIIAEPGAFGNDGGAEICWNGQVFELLRREKLGGGSHWEGIMRLKGGMEDVC